MGWFQQRQDRLGTSRPHRTACYGRRVLAWELLEARRLLTASANIGAADWQLSQIPAVVGSPLEPQPAYGPQLAPLDGPFANSETFRLHSKPDSNYTIYLDFDGHVTEGTTWNLANNLPSIVSPAYDRGNTPGVFTQLELDLIQNAWRRVAEDFAPFDVNVTTEDPGAEALRKDTSGSDTQWGVRVIMTTDTFANCNCGGFAYLRSFEDPTDEPAFVFNNSLDGVSETISHEVGHQLTLNHDGLTSPATEYYSGHGSGATSWGPIMGAPFNRPITQWDWGEYFNASNTADDLSAITTQNGFGYRTDDVGDSLASARRLEHASSTEVYAFGVIERNTDIDYYRFDTGGGNVNFTVAPQGDRPNLDVWAGIYSAAGALIAQSNPLTSLTATFTNLALVAGTYYLKVDGVGSHGAYNPVTDKVEDPVFAQPWKSASPTGYSHYGSLGQYAITGTIVAATTNLLSIAPLSADKREGNTGTTNYTFAVTRTGDSSAPASVDYRVTAARQSVPGENAPATVTPADFDGNILPSGTISFASGETSRLISIAVNGDTQVEEDERFAVTLDNPAPGWGLATSRAVGIIQGDESRANLKSGVQFRWRQENSNSTTGDNWALDNVSVSNTAFADDFDPAVDNIQWSEIVGGSANSIFGGSGNSLRFSGSGGRSATTTSLRAQSGDVLQFSLIFGNTGNGENVALEYTLDGGHSWKLIQVFDQSFYKTWSTFTVTVPDDVMVDTLSRPEGNSGPQVFPFTVFRTDNLDKSIDVAWSVAGTGSNPAGANDFAGSVFPSGTLSFAAGEAAKTIEVLMAGDAFFETAETFELRLESSTGGPLGYDRITATIENDDSPLAEDFGDAPDIPYGTLLSSDGPRHLIGGPFLGTAVDIESDGQPTASAVGDGSDEDGVRFVTPLVAGTSVDIEVKSSVAGGQLDYFFDWDGVGGFGNVPNEIFSATLTGGLQLLQLTIPAGAVSSTFARFRISVAGGLGPLGSAATGEVEDYAVTVFSSPPTLDFGDANTSYSTLQVDDGPRHYLTGLKLGTRIDSEQDGQVSNTSTGDGADDDGVIFRSRLIRGTTVDVSIESSGGILDYFFDFDGNGVFGNNADEIFSVAVASGTQLIPVIVPSSAALGISHARFRLSTSGGLGPRGLALDGEVEDYQIRIVDLGSSILNFDTVTAPLLPEGWTTSGSGSTNPWRTDVSLSDSAPNHAFVGNVAEISDSSLTSPVITLANKPVQLSFRNNYDTEEFFDGGVLEISIDGGAFQDIEGAGGTFASGGYVSPLSSSFGNPLASRRAWHGSSAGYVDTLVNLPATAQGKNIQLRWRMGSDDFIDGIGWRIDTIVISNAEFEFDYGDAPQTYGTMKTMAGAAHAAGGNLRLGTQIDYEVDGQPGAGADGDGTDDDGITLPSTLVSGTTQDIVVTASQAGILNAWIDFAADGNWSQNSDHIIKDFPLVAGPNLITVSIPSGLTPANTLSRWRLSSQSGLAFDGIAPDGEVEDFAVSISTDATPPSLTSVKVVGNLAGSRWSPEFIAYVDPVDSDNSDGSDQVGYAIPMNPPEQLRSLTWKSMNQIVLSFSEPVIGSGVWGTNTAVGLNDVNVYGINKTDYKTSGSGPKLTTVDFNPATNEATLTFDSQLTADKLLIHIAANSIRDAADNFLAPVHFRVNVLPGDADNSGYVLGSDLNTIRPKQGTSYIQGTLNPLLDIDGSGIVLGNDLNTVRPLQGSYLPAGEPLVPSGSLASTGTAPLSFKSRSKPTEREEYALSVDLLMSVCSELIP